MHIVADCASELDEGRGWRVAREGALATGLDEVRPRYVEILTRLAFRQKLRRQLVSHGLLLSSRVCLSVCVGGGNVQVGYGGSRLQLRENGPVSPVFQGVLKIFWLKQRRLNVPYGEHFPSITSRISRTSDSQRLRFVGISKPDGQ